MTQPDFIQIPTQLLTNEALQPADRILFGYIYWMTKLALMKCVASNATLAELSGFSEKTISISLSRLEEQGYVSIIYKDESRRHRVEIQTLIAYTTIKEARPTKRSIQTHRTVTLDPPFETEKGQNNRGKSLPNKSIKEEDIKRTSTNVLVNSDKPSVTKPKLEIFFYMLVEALGFSETTKFTAGREAKLRKRGKTYTGSEILKAATNLGGDAYMQGENESGKRYGTIDYLLRCDENVDKYLQVAELKFSEGNF